MDPKYCVDSPSAVPPEYATIVGLSNNNTRLWVDDNDVFLKWGSGPFSGAYWGIAITAMEARPSRFYDRTVKAQKVYRNVWVYSESY